MKPICEMKPITVVIAPEATRVRLLVRRGKQDMMKAVLGPVAHAHPRAVATLLEGLSLWHQERLGVVLCAAELSCGSGLGLCNALGFGEPSVHYEVGVAYAGRPEPRHQRLTGVGSFRDLRQLDVSEVMG